MAELIETTTRAGQLLRNWRKANSRSVEEAAHLLRISVPAVYRIEGDGRVPRHATAHAMVELGICEHADFHRAAHPERGEDDHVAACEACSLRPDSPEAKCCTRGDCPRRVAVAA